MNCAECIHYEVCKDTPLKGNIMCGNFLDKFEMTKIYKQGYSDGYNNAVMSKITDNRKVITDK